MRCFPSANVANVILTKGELGKFLANKFRQYVEELIVRYKDESYGGLRVKNNTIGSKKRENFMDWYLLRSKIRQEDMAESNLQRLGVESFCPHLKQTKLSRGKKRSVIIPLFPGYLFSKFDLNADYRKVVYAHGVADVVRFGETPARVDEEIIETIQARMLEGFITFSSPSYISGQTVQIQEGPFKGFSAVFERELTGTQRVALLLNSMSNNSRLIIERSWISPVVQTA